MKKLFSLIIILLTYNLYSGVSFTYSNGESLKHQRHLHQSQKLKDGRIIVFGGFNGYFGAPKYYSSTEIYYPEFDRWFEGPNMNTYRYNHSSSVLGDGRVITVGGSFNNSSEIFDPQTNEWKYINAPIGIASNTKLITLHDGRALIAGNGEEGRTKCNLFTPMDEKWIEGPSLNQNHGEGFSLTVLSSGKVIIIGGSTAQNSIEIYDPIKN